MEKEAARRILSVAMESSRRIDDSLKGVADSSHNTVFLAYRRCAARVMGYIYTEILAPIWNEHPDLAPEWFTIKSTVGENQMLSALRAELLSLMEDVGKSIEATAEVADGACSEEAAARYRQNIDEILGHVFETKTYLASLESIDPAPHDSAKAGSAPPS